MSRPHKTQAQNWRERPPSPGSVFGVCFVKCPVIVNKSSVTVAIAVVGWLVGLGGVGWVVGFVQLDRWTWVRDLDGTGSGSLVGMVGWVEF